MSRVRPKHLRLDRFAVQTLGERAEALRTAMLRARERPDADAVHDLRVAIRRLRACLTAFPQVFRRRPAQRLRRRLRRVFRRAGAVRDADIAIEMQGELGKLDRGLVKQRKSQAKRLRRLLRKRRIRKALHHVRRLGGNLKKDRREAAGVAAAAFADQLNALLAHGRALVAAEAEPAALHRLRIEVKKVRYAAEIFRPLLDANVEAILDDLSRLQTMLGEIQDCATALRLLPGGDTGPAAQLPAAELKEKQRRLQSQFFKHWRECVDAPAEIERRRPRHGAATASGSAT